MEQNNMVFVVVVMSSLQSRLCLCDSDRNQVDTFLEQHGGPGIQHVGLFTQDIVSTANTMADAGVQFFSPPEAYYTEVLPQLQSV